MPYDKTKLQHQVEDLFQKAIAQPGVYEVMEVQAKLNELNIAHQAINQNMTNYMADSAVSSLPSLPLIPK